MRTLAVLLLLVSLLINACTNTAGGTPAPDSAVDSSGYIQNKGSDTMVNLALAWAERYQQEHPEVRISVTGGGSGTGFASLLNNTVDIANASRQIKDEERQKAKDSGLNPQEFIVARDAIAVIVNPSNPISQLTLEEISAIFSGQINNWSELGGEDRTIVRVSRETNSGTHVYFLERVIRLNSKEDKTIFSADTLLLPSSEGIIAEVSDNPNAIGYDGLGYITPGVKMLAVAETYGSPYFIPSAETTSSGEYPISRDLYMYTGKEAAGIVKDYLDWIVTPEAQQIVVDLGFVPVAQKP